SPRSDDQSLQALFWLSQFHVIEIGNLCAPRVIPASYVVHRNVFVLRQMIDDARAVVFPELIVITVTHGMDQPIFVIRSELEWRGAGTKWQPAHIFLDSVPDINERRDRCGIGSCPHGCLAGIDRPGGIPHREYPIEPAQFKRAVVPNAIPPEI